MTNKANLGSHSTIFMGSRRLWSRSNRHYYRYPPTEEPQNNCCLWKGCSDHFPSLEDLVDHVNKVHIKKLSACLWMGCIRKQEPFVSEQGLRIHLRRHTGEKSHRCGVSLPYKTRNSCVHFIRANSCGSAPLRVNFIRII